MNFQLVSISGVIVLFSLIQWAQCTRVTYKGHVIINSAKNWVDFVDLDIKGCGRGPNCTVRQEDSITVIIKFKPKIIMSDLKIDLGVGNRKVGENRTSLLFKMGACNDLHPSSNYKAQVKDCKLYPNAKYSYALVQTQKIPGPPLVNIGKYGITFYFSFLLSANIHGGGGKTLQDKNIMEIIAATNVLPKL